MTKPLRTWQTLIHLRITQKLSKNKIINELCSQGTKLLSHSYSCSEKKLLYLWNLQ